MTRYEGQIKHSVSAVVNFSSQLADAEWVGKNVNAAT